MEEIERTFLAKYIPDGLKNCESREIVDVYIPKSEDHSILRIRKNGTKYEMTKKQPVNKEDRSFQKEETIFLTKEEFESLSIVEGKKVRKLRYYYPFNGRIAEFDVFLDSLNGLVLVDVEFEKIDVKDIFEIPEFCLAEVTQEDFIAGGMICGKKYEDIFEKLENYGYEKLVVE